MALQIKNSLVIEDIIDEKGNKIGEIKFNPNDSRIIKKLLEIMDEIKDSYNKLKNIGEINNIPLEELKSVEEFESLSEEFGKLKEGYTIGNDITKKVFDELSDIFGRDTINIITQNTEDLEMIEPLIEFITPYIQDSRSKQISKYINTNSNVMD